MSKSSACITIPIFPPIHIHSIWVPLRKPCPLLRGCHSCICPFYTFYRSWSCWNPLLRCLLPPWLNLRLWQCLPRCPLIIQPWSWCPISLLLSSQSLFFSLTLSPVTIQGNCSFEPVLNSGQLVFCFHQLPSDAPVHALFEFFNQWAFFITTSSCYSLEVLYKLLHCSSSLFNLLQFCYLH